MSEFSHQSPALASFGDLSVGADWVQTPMGRFPVKGSVWTVQDMSHTEEKISTTGIVLALVFVWFCLIGLLFLLMKESRTVGFIQVTVQGPGFHHATMVPAHSNGMLQAHAFVNYCRQLSAAH